MEIFMRSIAYSASEMDVRIALAEILHSPPFPTDPPINFGVRLFNKRKGCGTFTLPSEDVGTTFMRTYGSTGLSVKGRCILFQHSNRTLDQGLVNYLRTNPWEDPKRLQEEKNRRAQMSEAVRLKDFSFGRLCVDGTFLAFVDRSVKIDNATIECDLDRRQVRLTALPKEHSFAGLGTEDLFHAIFEMTSITKAIASYSPPQIKRLLAIDAIHDIPTIFLISNSPPIFESRLRIMDLSPVAGNRRSSLGEQSLPPMCHSLSLTFQSLLDRDTFLERSRLLRLPPVIFHEPILCRQYSYSQEQLAQLDCLMGKLRFGLAFEVEKALAEALLQPLDILSVMDDLVHLSNQQVDAAAAFRYFLTRTRSQPHGSTTHSRRRRRKQKHPANLQNLNFEPSNLSKQLQNSIAAYLSEQDAIWLQQRDSNRPFESYHLIVTPTSRILDGPLPDQSNSVLRRFGNHECFLRVSIQDENKAKLRRDQNIDLKDIVQSRFRPLLVDGLRLAGRHYEFLGYSMSGLKSHSVWFVTPFEGSLGDNMTAAHIRSLLGDLSPLAHEPARLAARWSQAFSATDPTVTLTKDQIQRIPDRTSANGSIFTDGCSVISCEMSQMVWDRLCRQRAHYSKSKTVPSAFQFRLGGAKGVVVQDPGLVGKVICLRPSQTKFEAPDVLTFDIQSTSLQPKAMFLNRPLIMLLEYLGVEPSSIMALQATAIHEVQSIRTSLSQASKIFVQHGLGASFQLPSLFNNIFVLLELEISGHSHPGFFRHKLVEDALYCAAIHALREIKYRAHIPVPGSVTLLGVADEWDCLEEGEIYATVHRERSDKTEAITGPVLITRSPQVHPGDVQLVTAVRRDELSHLTNVVVFSSKGKRCLPSCLGGGDLDGDDYNLILDTDLHPPLVETPGAYIPLPRKRTENPCTIVDVADFVIDFIETDLIGYISNLHLRLADLQDPKCDECLQLAEAASHAVDFPKTGTPVNFNKLPRAKGPEKPDFLAPENADVGDITRFYPSQKLLGVLYRSVPTEQPAPALQGDRSSTDGDTIYSALKRIDLHALGLPSLEAPSDTVMEEMESLLYNYYVEKLFSIAKTHAVSRHAGYQLSEAEIISGTIMAKWSDHRKRREAIIAMNFQTHELAKDIRDDLHRVSCIDWDQDDALADEEVYEDQESEMDRTKRAEVFKRAWAAWNVAEEALRDNPETFGAQSFGLIALGVLLGVVKDAGMAK